MADFKQASQWLKEGKKIKRKNWRIDGDVHLKLVDADIIDSYKHIYKFDYDDINADNWEIYRDEKIEETLSDWVATILKDRKISWNNDVEVIEAKKVKECFDLIKGDFVKGKRYNWVEIENIINKHAGPKLI